MSAAPRSRVPLVPTIVVALAVLLMVRLGVWQIHRLHEKEALLARYEANAALPPVALAALLPVREEYLYRRTSAACLGVVRWQAESGRARDGTSGWRHIASCRTGAEGAGFAVDMGISQSPAPPVGWPGGLVRGRLTWLPTAAPLIARLLTTAAPRPPLIVSEAAAPGFGPTQQPDPSTIPNNHLSYAVQWFLFAIVAAVIYSLVLWQRARK